MWGQGWYICLEWCARSMGLWGNFCTFGEMDFIAKIEESQKSNIQEIAKSLEKMGIRINRIMRITGTISGSSSSLPLAQIKIKGIKSVEQNRRLRAH